MSHWNSLMVSLRTEAPADIGPKRRADALSEEETRTRVNEHLSAIDLPATQQRLVMALALLWHDHLDASHRISQDIMNADGSFVHGVMHRREPDYSNAKYWFRRVGAHPIFPILAQRAHGKLGGGGAEETLSRIAPDANTWDPFAFVDACAAADTDGRRDQCARIQEIEYETLMARFHGELN